MCRYRTRSFQFHLLPSSIVYCCLALQDLVKQVQMALIGGPQLIWIINNTHYIIAFLRDTYVMVHAKSNNENAMVCHCFSTLSSIDIVRICLRFVFFRQGWPYHELRPPDVIVFRNIDPASPSTTTSTDHRC